MSFADDAVKQRVNCMNLIRKISLKIILDLMIKDYLLIYKTFGSPPAICSDGYSIK